MGIPLIERIQLTGVVGGTKGLQVPFLRTSVRQSLFFVLPPGQRLELSRIRWRLPLEGCLDADVGIAALFNTRPFVSLLSVVLPEKEGDITFSLSVYNSLSNPVDVTLDIAAFGLSANKQTTLAPSSSWWFDLNRRQGPPLIDISQVQKINPNIIISDKPFEKLDLRSLIANKKTL